MGNFFGRNMNFLAIIIGAVIIGGFLYSGISNNNQNPAQIQTQVGVKSDITPTTSCGATDKTIVTKVIDGDTVVVEGGYHVRLLGMDADESGYPCDEPAKTRLEDLVSGKNVILEKDVSDVDQYGRCLRYISINNMNVDVQLVKEGLAIARFYEPDIKYKTEITTAEKQAQQNHLGCKWAQ